MAITEIDRSDSRAATPPPGAPAEAPPKNKGGRPKGSGWRKREEAARAAAVTAIQNGEVPMDLALSPTAELSRDDEFNELMEKLDWSRHIAYIYRLRPIHDRTGDGRPKYVTKFTEAFDENTLMLQHGSGKYRVDINFIPAVGDKRKAYTKVLEIMNPDYPPNLPAGDWVDDPRNADWQWSKEKIMQNGTATGANPENVANAVVKLMREMHPTQSAEEQKTLTTQIITLVEKNQEQMRNLMDPTKQIETMKQLIALAHPAGNGESAVVTILTGLLNNMREDAKELRAEIRASREQAPKQQGFSFKELRELKSEMPELFGNNGTQATSLLDLANSAINSFAPSLGKIAEALTIAVIAKQQQPRPAATTITHQPVREAPAAKTALERRRAAATEPAATTTPEPEPAPAAADGPNPPSEGPQPQIAMTAEQQARVMQLAPKYGLLISQCVPFLVDHFKALDGNEFRDWFIPRKGFDTWAAMRQEMSIDDLMSFAKFDAKLWEQLQPEEKFREFLTDFFSEPQEEEDGEDKK